MTKRGKILACLILISVSLIFYMLFTSKIVTIKPQNQAMPEPGEILTKVDEAQMETDYKAGINAIVSDYDLLLSDFYRIDNATSSAGIAGLDNAQLRNRINNLKISLTKLKAPEKINEDAKRITLEYLLPSFNALEDYLADGQDEDKEKAETLALKIKSDFPALIN